MWEFWWTEWHCERLFTEYFGCSPVNIIPPSISILIYTWGMNNIPDFAAVQRHNLTPSTWTTTSSEVRFQVLTAASMKFGVFWDVAPCSLGVD
jgi:hypothetical protein